MKICNRRLTTTRTGGSPQFAMKYTFSHQLKLHQLVLSRGARETRARTRLPACPIVVSALQSVPAWRSGWRVCGHTNYNNENNNRSHPASGFGSLIASTTVSSTSYPHPKPNPNFGSRSILISLPLRLIKRSGRAQKKIKEL